MTDLEIDTFIETMEEYGDAKWTPEKVRDSIFITLSLKEAISKRRSECSWLSDILAKSSGLL